MSTAASSVIQTPPSAPPLASHVPPLAPALHVVPATYDAVRDRPPLDRLFDLEQPPGYYAAAAKTALLRRSRRRPHDQLLVDFAGRDVLVELTAAGRVIAASAWNWQATVDGRPLAQTGPWTEVCWHTDADVDYLEVEVPLTDGWRIERQAVLGRKDRFLLLADALLGPAERASAELRYATTIPMAGGVRLTGAGETREGWLTSGKKKVATIVPLAQPEWRAELCHADLAGGGDGTLVLMQAAEGTALYAPLWIDLAPARVRQPLTWRRLAVGENLQTVPRDRAAGYRVQFGGQNWLIYRTLTPPANRTVLGQNFSSEFVCCRMLKSGKTESIIEIQ